MSVTADELLELVAERDRLDARLTTAVGEFDAEDLWDLDAATSMQAWLRDQAGMSGRDAHRLVVLARRTVLWPVTREAWRSGALSSGQVQAILEHVGSHTALFAEHEAEVVPTLVPLSVHETVTAMQVWRRHADALAENPPDEPAEPPSTVQLSPVGGRGALRGDLDAEDQLIVATALRVADSGDVDVLAPQRRADALVDVCRFFLDNQKTKSGGRHRPHLNVIVNADDWSGSLPSSVLERFCCDSAMHRVITDGRSAILDVGVATRVLTAAMWTALVIRDDGCRFAGCDRPATWCDGHHIHWFSRGGPTRLDNLVLLCRRHH
ncbi:MAG TPA: DUF222 domain-containing protein, partial [Mycobacteriales bacterium]|nr:DUF222 domain-containing protein [Mycobacteriales bacterium]